MLTSRMMCAGAAKGKFDTCGEESGGGSLVCEKNAVWYVVGVNSWGAGCEKKGLYDVYADVKVMRPWIDKVVYNM